VEIVSFADFFSFSFSFFFFVLFLFLFLFFFFLVSKSIATVPDDFEKEIIDFESASEISSVLHHGTKFALASFLLSYGPETYLA
jgi:hypothetical protein